MASQSLYRTYRPQHFRDVVGQEHVRQALLHTLRDGSVRHAYLFSGPRGTGKTTMARLLAKALNCLDPAPDGEPCGVCGNCESIAAGTFPDLIELDAASNNKVDEMRDLIERVHFGLSATGRRKVYIVDEVHMLTTGSSNALLKTLEEPPEHVVFVLATTDPHKVLPTIRSRTQHFELNLLDTEQLTGLVRHVLAAEQIEADDDAVEAVVRRGGGSARDALSALDQALAVGARPGAGGALVLETARVVEAFGGSGFERRVAVVRALADDDPAGALVALHEALQHGTAPRELAEELLETLRDAFIQTAGRGRVPYSGPEPERAELVALAEAAGLGRLTRGIETLGDAIADMRGQGAPDPRLVLEVAIVKLARRDTVDGIDALRERLDRLEARIADGGAAAPASPTSGPTTAAPGRALGTEPVRRDGAPASEAHTTRTMRTTATTATGRDRGTAPVALDDAPVSTDPDSATPSPSGPPAAGPGGAKPALAGVLRAREPAAPKPRREAPPTTAPGSELPRAEHLDLDDVIVAWLHALDALSAFTRGLVQEAQPIGVAGDIITFGVAGNQLVAVDQRFKSNADEIRARLAEKLGGRVRFKLVAHDFGADGALRPLAAKADASGPTASPHASAPAIDLVEADEDAVDLTELVDAPREAVDDGVSLLQATFGAQIIDDPAPGG